MVIESVKQFAQKESLIAALKLLALGEKDRIQGQGISVAESRAQLAAARQVARPNCHHVGCNHFCADAFRVLKRMRRTHF